MYQHQALFAHHLLHVNRLCPCHAGAVKTSTGVFDDNDKSVQRMVYMYSKYGHSELEVFEMTCFIVIID